MNNMLRLFIHTLLLFWFYSISGQAPVINTLRVKAFLKENKYQETIEQIDNSQLTLFEKLKTKGYCKFKLGNYNEALFYFFKTDSILPNSSALEIAQCYSFLNQKEKTFAWLQKYLNQNNKISEYEIINDKSFERYFQTDEWNNLWKKEWYTPSDIEKSAISALIKRKNYTEALKRLESNRTIIKPSSDLLHLEAKIYFALSQNDFALTSINKAIENNHPNEEFYILKSQILLKKKDFNQSLKFLNKAIEINPYEPDYYYKRASIAIELNNPQMAQLDLEIYRNLFPNTSETLNLMAKLEVLKTHYSVAIDYYSQLIEIEKNNATYYVERGDIAYNAGKLEMANSDMAMALDIDPNIPLANLIKGKISLDLKDKETACYYFKNALRLGNMEAQKWIDKNCSK